MIGLRSEILLGLTTLNTYSDFCYGWHTKVSSDPQIQKSIEEMHLTLFIGHYGRESSWSTVT